MACGDGMSRLAKAEKAAQMVAIPQDSYTIMPIDLETVGGVRQFVNHFRTSGKSLDALVCNAAIYLPLLKEPLRSPEGYGVDRHCNHLGHFLLCNLMLEDLQKSSAEDLGGSLF